LGFATTNGAVVDGWVTTAGAVVAAVDVVVVGAVVVEAVAIEVVVGAVDAATDDEGDTAFDDEQPTNTVAKTKAGIERTVRIAWMFPHVNVEWLP
jgi:hypothetical protein